MLAEFFSLLLLSISITGWGLWFECIFSIKKKSFSINLINGLILLSIVCTVISLFRPLNFLTEIILLMISITPFFIKKTRTQLKSLQISTPYKVWVGCFLIIIICTTSYHPFIPDHFSYYIPTLSWLNTYGIIPGIANIDWVLGQMSTLHILQAGMDNTIDPFQRINIVICFIYLLYIFERKAWLLLLFLPISFLYLQTPSPDLLIILFSLIVVNEICFNKENRDLRLLFLISIFVFTIKPIAFWLPLWVFVVGIKEDRKEISQIKNYIFPLLIIALFFLKNIIASSSLVFPITFTNISTPWTPDSEILSLSNEAAAAFTFNNNIHIQDIESFSLCEKLYYWITLKELRTLINIFILIITLAFGYLAFYKKNFIYISLFLIIVIKIIVIVNFSGQYRFLLDGTYPLIFILLKQIQWKEKRIMVPLFCFNLFIFSVISFSSVIQTVFPKANITYLMGGFTKNSLIKPQEYTFNEYKKEELGNLNFNVSYQYIFNFDTPPPAFLKKKVELYYGLGIFPQWINPSNERKGFYMKKLSVNELKQLNNIIDKAYENEDAREE